jgi:hypothetical protein
MFVTSNEVARRSSSSGSGWVEQFPIEAIRGPFSLDGRQPGLLTDIQRAVRRMPYNPPYYPEIIEGAGYAPFQTAHLSRASASSSAPPRAPHRRDEDGLHHMG